MGNFHGGSEDLMLVGMQSSKSVLMRFQTGARTIGVYTCCTVAKNLSTFCLYPETLYFFFQYWDLNSGPTP
jgi:hypothetical protein